MQRLGNVHTLHINPNEKRKLKRTLFFKACSEHNAYQLNRNSVYTLRRLKRCSLDKVNKHP